MKTLRLWRHLRDQVHVQKAIMNEEFHAIAARSCFDLVLIGGIEQEADKFGLPMGSGFLKNA